MRLPLRAKQLMRTFLVAAGLLLAALAWPALASTRAPSPGSASQPRVSPHSGWSNFTPSGWVTTTTLVASVRVTDSAGLNLTTAVYAYSTDGGLNWSGWASATAAGTISTAAVISTPLLTFADGITNAVRFAISDTATIPDTDYSPTYTLRISSTPPTRVYLPIVFKNATGDTYEPNNSRSGAYGPLASGTLYASYIWSAADTWDCYWFDPSGLGTVTINLTSIPPGTDYDLFLYDSTTSTTSVANSRKPGNADEQIVYSLGHDGRHYICVYAYSGWSNTDSYLLSVTYP